LPSSSKNTRLLKGTERQILNAQDGKTTALHRLVQNKKYRVAHSSAQDKINHETNPE
jgi:hypothetical protein